MMQFGNDIGTFGSGTPGVKCFAVTVGDINPSDCVGYKNVVIMCGLNNIRSSYVKTADDIIDIYDTFKVKIEQIQYVNRRASIFFCPVIPTRSHEINKKSLYFNDLVFRGLIPHNDRMSTVHGFDRLLDQEGRLDQQYAKEHDQIHLNMPGAKFIARSIKKCIFDRRRSEGRRSAISNKPLYSAVAGRPH